jgi:hypothetical protein
MSGTLSSPIIDKDTLTKPVPVGSSTGVFDWFGRLFVPDAVEKDWIRNDAEIRARAQNDASSKDITARIASDPAMAKSAANVRVYTSAPFIGGVLTGEELATIAGDAILDAPRVLIDTTSEKVLAPITSTIGQTIKNLVPWQVWLIVGIAVVVGVSIVAYVKAQ